MPRRRAVAITRQAISPRLAMRILLNMVISSQPWIVATPRLSIVSGKVSLIIHPLHPEQAEVSLLDRRIQAGRKTQSQHAPRVRRVDDTIVPEPGTRLIRITLPLILLAARRLESFPLFHRPVAAP